MGRAARAISPKKAGSFERREHLPRIFYYGRAAGVRISRKRWSEWSNFPGTNILRNCAQATGGIGGLTDRSIPRRTCSAGGSGPRAAWRRCSGGRVDELGVVPVGGEVLDPAAIVDGDAFLF